MGARRVELYVLRMRKRFLFACQLRISIHRHANTHTQTHRHIRVHMFVYVCVCVDRERGAGRVRGAAQTSSIQKQMEKVMIICLANAAQSGREGSTRVEIERKGGEQEEGAVEGSAG